MFDATPMVTNKTGIAYYTERLAVNMAKNHPDEVEMVGFYYNFLGKRDVSHLPRLKNLRYTRATFVPSKVVYQLRRWGVEFPIEILTLERADFILYPNFISHPSLLKIPQASVIHDLTFFDLPQYVSPKLQRDLIRFVPRDIKRSKFVITVSEFSKQRIADEYNVASKDILVTPVPPVPPVFHKTDQQNAILQKAGIKKPFILFIGTIEPRKNLVGLIEAYKNLPKSVRDEYGLVLAGRIERFAKNEAKAIEAAAKDGYNVTHLGYISDELKEVLYQTTDLFVTASQYEGFGMPILEAMSYGTPCAVSDIPVFREVAKDAALYFDQNDTKSISQTLDDILSDKKRLAKHGQQSSQLASSYNWSKVAESVLQKIKKSLSNG